MTRGLRDDRLLGGHRHDVRSFGRVPRNLGTQECATLGRIPDVERSAVELGEITRNGQPETRASEAAGRSARELAEALEHGLTLLGGDAGTAVGDLEDGGSAGGLLAERAADPPAGGSELEGVRQQVQEQALELLHVHLRVQLAGGFNAVGDPVFLGEDVEMSGHQSHEARQIGVAVLEPHLPGFQLRGVEQVVHVPEQRPGVADHHFQVAAGAFLEPGRREQPLRPPDDEREGRAQLVADVGEELRLQLVQLLGLLVEARELFVGSPELPVRVVQLAGPQVDLGLHLLRAAPELFGELRLLGPLLLEADELRHVLDPVDDVRHVAVEEDR